MRLRAMHWALMAAVWLCPFAAFAAAATDYSNAGHWMYAPRGGKMPGEVF